MRRSIPWHFRGLFAALIVLALVLPPAAPTSAETALDWAIPGGRFFTQANGQGGAGGTGYSVMDDAVAPFWSEFRRLGGVEAIGYPASRRFTWDGFVVQVFQKAVFQWRPEVGQAYFVNVFDRLSAAGKDDWLNGARATPPSFDHSADQGLAWDDIVKRHLALLDVNPAIKARYLADSDPIQHFGLPMSSKDYGNVFVVRAQRAVFQQWQENVPWAKAGQVVIANGGDIGKEAGVYPSEVLQVETAPAGAPASAPPPVLAAGAAAGAALSGGLGHGMQVDIGAAPDRALELVRGAGFNWAKFQVRWGDMERDRGNIDWGSLDNAVNLAAARGVKVLMSVVTAPNWSRPGNTDWSVPGPPANPQDFANFLSTVASRYKGRVHAIEVWNEQNLWYEWGGTGRKLSASQYVDMLRHAYAAIKAVDSNIVVVSGAPTPTGVNDGDVAIDDVAFVQQMYAAGLKNVSDAIGAHPSGYNNAPDDDPGRNTTGTSSFKGHWSFYYRRFEQFRDVMVANGDGNKKLWFTEFGWASSPNPYPEYAYAADNDEGEQARFLVRAFEIAKAKGYIGAMFLWNLNFAASADKEDRYAKKAFAILHPDFSLRPAYGALSSMPK